MILNPEDMPQTADGIRPDIIVNPHAIPSRMTIAQLMETLMGKIGCVGGFYGDGTPFNNITLEGLTTLMRDKYGLEPHGNDILYNGHTGKQMETSIFIGPCFYQRLRHCSADKIHSRASGPLVMLTRQPAEGRARDGGLRFGKLFAKVRCKSRASPIWRGDTIKFRGRLENTNLMLQFKTTTIIKEMTDVIWKIIANYDNYSVSNTGCIKNNITNRILKYYIRNGYKSVSLSKNNRKKTVNIHNIVAEHFLNKPDNYKYVVNHKNENKLDNNATNLEYITYRENTIYSMTPYRTRNDRVFNMNDFVDIPNYSNYMASKCGEIYSKNIKRLCCHTILPNKYHKIKLKSDSNIYKDLYIHVIVAMTYLNYNPHTNQYVINHIDGNKENNNLDNLQIVTPKENMQHSVIMNNATIFRKSVYYINENGHRIEYASAKDASYRTNIDNSSILKSCKSDYKRAGGIKWYYTSNS